MKRELRPGLFDFDPPATHRSFAGSIEGRPSEELPAPERFQYSHGTAAFVSGRPPAAATPPVPDFSRELEQLQQKLDSQQMQWNQILEEKDQTLRKQGQFISGVHQAQTKKFADVDAKITQLKQALGEREAIDKKIQELVDRHNQIVRNFENRLTHLMRVVSEQELQILQSKEALEEARRELAKVRK